MDDTTAGIRRRRIGALVDLARGRGLEIGPLSSAVAQRPEYDVRYVDAWSQADLRAHYAQDPNVVGEDIPAMDFILIQPDRTLGLAEAVGRDAPYAWVVASHVIEHVPDVIGWLGDIASVLADDGELVLAIPDRRFCFDARRQATSVGQMIHAHDLRSTVPSVRAVFDHFREAVSVTSAGLWRGATVDESARIHGLEQTLELTEQARSGQYIDCHVWTFTPESFCAQVLELGRLELTDIVLHHLVPTSPDELEFYAILRRLPRGLDRVEAQARVETGGAAVAALASPESLRAATGHGVDEDELRAQAEALTSASARCMELEAELAAVKTSERWRVGGTLVGPAARLLAALQGRRGQA